MKRTPIRVDPISIYLERRRKGPIYPVIVAGGTVYVSGLPPMIRGPARSSACRSHNSLSCAPAKEPMHGSGRLLLDRVLKCNVHCTPHGSHFGIFNDVYSRYFPADAPAPIFLHVPSLPGPFDIEGDCIAVI